MVRKELVDLLLKGAVCITPTRTLARSLARQVNLDLAKKQKAWSTPKISALDDWLLALWGAFETKGKTCVELLTLQQALLCWQTVIAQSKSGFFEVRAMAKMAWQAWVQLQQWQVAIGDLVIDNADQATFQQWATHYQTWLNSRKLIDSTQLPKALLALMAARQGGVVVLYGFERLVPLIDHFFDKLSSNGWAVKQLDPLPKSAQAQKMPFKTQLEEYQAVARWAQKLCLQGQTQIAIVVPDLAKQRSKIASVFKDTFDLSFAPTMRKSADFSISLALSLAQYPLIEAAIMFLKIGMPTLSLVEYAAILTSCFTKGSQTEQFARVAHVCFLKSLPKEMISLKTALSFIKPEQEATLSLWSKVLKALLNYEDLTVAKTWAKWATCFNELVAIMGWPGERPLDSIEEQVVKGWHTLLSMLAQYEITGAKVSYAKALSALKALAAEIPFEPEHPVTPVQILGVLEAAGQQFNHLWVTGMQSEAWPLPICPHPFISAAFQRIQKMPHASAEQERIYARKITKRLMQSAKEVIFSYPLTQDEKRLEVSGLIKELPLAPPFKKPALPLPKVSLETFYDDKAPALAENEKHGNVSTLALQAMCPFKAFSQLRLKAVRWDWQDIWLQPAQRGILLHAILESFWRKFKDQSTLKQCDEKALNAYLEKLIEQKLLKVIHEAAPTLYRQVEKKRLYKILQDCIAKEKQRAPFVVVATETEKKIALEGMVFTLRLDRIDKGADNSLFLIDYKTGKFKMANLWGMRPKAPQLPLYYLATATLAPCALWVTLLDSQSCQYVGISANALALPGVDLLDQLDEDGKRLSWDQLHGYWSLRLGALARAFQRGEASVSPLEGSRTCQYCQFSSLCRVKEHI